MPDKFCVLIPAYCPADCDGQHTPEDVMRIAEAVKEHPDDLILGVRDFSVAADGSKVPFRSRFGNMSSYEYFRKCQATKKADAWHFF